MRFGIITTLVLGLVAFGYQGDTAAVDPSVFMAEQNGDVNADTFVDLSDAVYLLQNLYLGGPELAPLKCEPNTEIHNGDVNGDFSIDLSDPVYLITWLFIGGPDLVPACVEL